jgi:hypothetical protein
MSKFFYRSAVGIDISADFSVVAILVLDGEIRREHFHGIYWCISLYSFPLS